MASMRRLLKRATPPIDSSIVRGVSINQALSAAEAQHQTERESAEAHAASAAAGWSRGHRSQTVGADCLTVCHLRDRWHQTERESAEAHAASETQRHRDVSPLSLSLSMCVCVCVCVCVYVCVYDSLFQAASPSLSLEFIGQALSAS